MACPLALQLYTLRREAERGFVSVLERVPSIGFVGVETAGLLQGIRAEDFRRCLDDLGLQISSSYLLLGPEDTIEGFLDEQQTVGNNVIVSSLGPEDFASAAAVDRAAERFNQTAEILGSRGMKLGYHNHWWEYAASADGWIPMNSFVEGLEAEIFLEFDVYWLQTEGFDPAVTLRELGSRVRRLFLKDGPCTRSDLPTSIGTGRVDFDAAVGAVPHAEWHVVAFDEYAGDMFEAVEASCHYLIGHGLSRGRLPREGLSGSCGAPGARDGA